MIPSRKTWSPLPLTSTWSNHLTFRNWKWWSKERSRQILLSGPRKQSEFYPWQRTRLVRARGSRGLCRTCSGGHIECWTVIALENILVHFSTYLKHSPGSLEYRLINRNIESGYVKVNNHELLRLLQESIKEKVSIIPILRKPSDLIKDSSKELIAELPKISPSKISFKKGDNPPCIESLLISVKKHHNLNHHARWYLAVYLINKKMDSEKIIELYSNLPDFNEKISRYQIEHAKKQNYLPPSCSTIRGYGLCTANCPIKNPIQWGSKFYKKPKEKKDDKKWKKEIPLH